MSYVIYLTSLLALFSIVHEPEETPNLGRMQMASIAAVTLPTDPEAPIQGDMIRPASDLIIRDTVLAGWGKAKTAKQRLD